MTPIKHYIEILPDGSMTNAVPYKAFLKALGELRKGRWCLSIEKYYPKRSNDQNRFYWGNYIQSEIECFQERWGETYTIEQMHDFNRTNIWGEQKVIEETGEIVKVPESSAGQSTVSWEEKLEKGRQWFRQSFDWEIGYPEKQTDLKI